MGRKVAVGIEERAQGIKQGGTDELRWVLLFNRRGKRFTRQESRKIRQ